MVKIDLNDLIKTDKDKRLRDLLFEISEEYYEKADKNKYPRDVYEEIRDRQIAVHFIRDEDYVQKLIDFIEDGHRTFGEISNFDLSYK